MIINDVKLIDYPRIFAPDGQLSVFESFVTVPYQIKRVFTVLADGGTVRGDHAHRECSQILVCLSGEIRVDCDDGHGGKASFLIKPKSKAILVPPWIWAVEEYILDNSVLLVLCDRIYDPDEYIRDYNFFIQQKATHS